MAKNSKSNLPWAEIGSAAFGATIGGVLGMLFAPQSGKKTRQAISSEGKKIVKSSVKTAQKVKKEVEGVVAKQIKKATPKATVKIVAVKDVKKSSRSRVSKGK